MISFCKLQPLNLKSDHKISKSTPFRSNHIIPTTQFKIPTENGRNSVTWPDCRRH